MNTWRIWLRTLGITGLVALCGVTVASAVLPVQNERGAVVRAITTWDYPEGLKHCDGSYRPSWDNMATAWYDDLTNGAAAPNGHGTHAWWKDGLYVNEWIVDSQYIDPDKEVWGKDFQDDYADEPDALMIAMHGGNGPGGRWTGSVRANQGGNDGSNNNCGTWQGAMEFGDGDIEFLHLSSCTSMDQPDWYPNWASSFKGVHQIDGFHGNMFITPERIVEYKNFASDAFDTSIAASWLENLYEYNSAGSNQCPVALAAGVGVNGAASCWDRMNHERYNVAYSDPDSPTFYCVAFIEGCDPLGGNPLPVNAGFSAPSAPAAYKGDGATSATGGSDELPPLDRTAKTLADYVAQVNAALPAIPTVILGAGAGPDWMSAVSVARVATAVSDSVPETIVSDGPRTEGRDTADTKVYKLDTESGGVRYINRGRHFNWDTDPHSAWPSSISLAMVQNAINLLGVPAGERATARVDTMSGQDYQSSSPTSVPNSAIQMERWVTIERTINGFAVEESIVRAAVSNHGQIARLQVRWPRFSLRPGLTLRPRQDVVAELAARIQLSEFGAAVNLEIHLAYARSGADYIPVAVATFDDPYSAETVSVPLVGVPLDQDFDGAADAVDNCVEDKNAGQQDRDGDGVGDACDNCPDTANPGQEDGDPSDVPDPLRSDVPDGTGDACQVTEDVCQMPDGSCERFTPAQCAAEGSGFASELASPLRFTASNGLSWNAVPGSTYNVYRGTLGGPSWGFDHACFDHDLSSPMTQDSAVPPQAAGFYYLLSVETACGETGLGSSSNGSPRPNNSPCP